MKKKKILAFISIVLVIFSVFNIFRLTYRETRYAQFVKNVPKNYGIRITSIDDFSYSVIKPGYLKFNGNLSITDESTSECLLIWPIFPSGYVFGVDILDGENLILVYVSSDGKFVASTDGNDLRAKELCEKRRDYILKLLRLANEMWDFK